MLGTLTNPLPTHVAYSVLSKTFYAVNFSLPGKGKSPLIPTFFSLLTVIACVSVNILGRKKKRN